MTADVSTPSMDWNTMRPYWEMVSSILGGASVMRKSPKYLPKFPNESQTDYDFRLKNAKFTNIFGDIVETLSAKPFSKEVAIKADPAPQWATDFIEDVDTRGNHLHVYASRMFYSGITDAVSWVLVDYTRNVPQNASVALEKALGARPYWVHIPAIDVISVESAQINGKEQFTHLRFREDATVREGYEEKTVERIRELNREPVVGNDGKIAAWKPATFTVWEKKKDQDGKESWEIIDAGPITIGVIPLVPFLTGRRAGSSWVVKPILRDAADLQIELFQQESGLKYAKENTAFPMLAGNGVEAPTGKDGKLEMIPVGPKTVLFAPPNGEGDHGEWKFIEPNASSLKFLADDVKETIVQLRELGRQPLTAQTGNLTVITTAFAADKANSVIQAWAFNLKDALENAFVFTAMWLKQTDAPDVFVDTDFDVNVNDETGPANLIALRASGDLSQRTLWAEMKRRGTLSPEFDPEEEEQLLIDELPGDDTDQDVLDAA